MSANEFDVLMPVVIMLAIAVLLFAGALGAAYIISPSKPTELKSTPYECGELPIGDAWAAFNIRFYVVGLIFIIFDVESVLMFPVATIFRRANDAGNGSYVLVMFISFISVLCVGIAYCWRKGDLDWVRSYATESDD